MGNTRKNVSVGEFENLSKKVEVFSNLLKVCQNNEKICQDRLRDVEITCELLKKNDIVLKDYSICYPDEEDESMSEDHTKENEIKSLEIAKDENMTEIKKP